jgi:hypothetical protein
MRVGDDEEAERFLSRVARELRERLFPESDKQSWQGREETAAAP